MYYWLFKRVIAFVHKKIKSVVCIQLCVFLTLSIYGYSQAEEGERVILQQTITKDRLVPAGTSFWGAETKEVRELFPGNNTYGFFYKEANSNEGYCRIRMKILCDYGLEMTKPIVDQNFRVKYKAMYFETKTDPEGLVDLIYRCSNKIRKEKFEVSVAKFKKIYFPTEQIGEIRIENGQCK